MPVKDIHKQQENLYNHRFKQLLGQWDCIKPEDDIGFDYIVQPYDDFVISETKEINALPKQFLVQLKIAHSNKSKRKYTDVTLKHLNFWDVQFLQVMLVGYDKESDSFHYSWISDLEIKKDGVKQRVYLERELNGENAKGEKLHILKKIFPIKIDEIQFSERGKPWVTLEPHIKRPIFPEELIPLNQEAVYKSEIFQSNLELKEQITENPKNSAIRIQYAFNLILMGQIDEARTELIYLRKKFKSSEATLLLKVLKDKKQSLLQQITPFRFVNLLLWVEDKPSDSSIDVYISLDGNEKTKLVYSSFGVIMPFIEWRHLDINVEYTESSDGKSPRVMFDKFNMYKVIQMQNGSIFHPYLVEIGTYNWRTKKFFLLSQEYMEI